MKRLIVSIALLLIISTYLLSCEKDDICATPTTPSVVIEFYQKDNPTVPKNVDIKFHVLGSDKMDSIGVNPAATLKLPLRVDANTTQWYLTYRQVTGAGTFTNTDILEFSYQTKNTYVSRACGFKTTFTLNPDTEEKNAIDIPEKDGLWIPESGFDVLKYNIEDENEAHIKIYL